MNPPSAIEPDDRLGGADRLQNIATDRGLMLEEEALPEESLTQQASHDFILEKRTIVAPDTNLAKQVTHYLSQERREKLDRQIETLYSRVAHELHDNPKDVTFALKRLQQAQDIVLEDMWRYEEALYSITEIKTMLLIKQTWRRWSNTWGPFVFFYALIWLALFIAAFFIDMTAWIAGVNIMGIWFAALAGGIGGVVGILYHLYWHVSIRVDFDRQYLMNYLIQPIFGFILGGVIFLISSAGFILADAKSLDDSAPLIDGVQRFQMLLGFLAGFNQQVVYSAIDRIIKRLLPGHQNSSR
jgi:hypothetical protein